MEFNMKLFTDEIKRMKFIMIFIHCICWFLLFIHVVSEVLQKKS